MEEQQEEKPLGFFDKMKGAYNDAVDQFSRKEAEPEHQTSVPPQNQEPEGNQ